MKNITAQNLKIRWKMIKKLTSTLFAFLCTTSALVAQKTDNTLQKEIKTLLQTFNGEVGIYIKNLRTQKTVCINADTIYPTASIVKIPILIGIEDKLQKKELQYHQQITYKDSLFYAGEDILGSFKNNETIELSKVIMLMLTTSDNTASLWLQGLAGTGIRINEILSTEGFIKTRVNSRTIGRENDRNTFGWGQTTPKEMGTLMEKIYLGKILNKEASNHMLKLLSRNYWDEEGLSQIPAGVFVASKNGAINASRSEVMYVAAPKNPYIFCICTKNIKDQSWEANNEAWELTRALSKLVWMHYGNK